MVLGIWGCHNNKASIPSVFSLCILFFNVKTNEQTISPKCLWLTLQELWLSAVLERLPKAPERSDLAFLSSREITGPISAGVGDGGGWGGGWKTCPWQESQLRFSFGLGRVEHTVKTTCYRSQTWMTLIVFRIFIVRCGGIDEKRLFTLQRTSPTPTISPSRSI